MIKVGFFKGKFTRHRGKTNFWSSSLQLSSLPHQIDPQRFPFVIVISGWWLSSVLGGYIDGTLVSGLILVLVSSN
jgi:hypothetical protein